MIRTLSRHGNSQALVIDKALMDLLGITNETPLQLSVTGQTLTVTPANVGLGEEAAKASIGKLRRRYGRMLKNLSQK